MTGWANGLLVGGYLLALAVLVGLRPGRKALWALSVQSFLTGLLILKTEGVEHWATRLQLLDLFGLRTLALPLLLLGTLGRLDTAHSDVGRRSARAIGPGSWLSFAGLVAISAWFGHQAFPAELSDAFQLAAALSGVVVGVFLLARETAPAGQIIGLLTVEGGIVLTETLGGHGNEWYLPPAIALVFLWNLVIFRIFLKRLPDFSGPSASPLIEEPEGEVL